MDANEHGGTTQQSRIVDDGRRLHELQCALSTTLAIMHAGYICLDCEGRVTDMNDMAQEATGWPLNEARGVSVWEVFKREDRPETFLRRNPIDLVQEQGWHLDEGRTMVLISRQGHRLRTDVRAAVTRDRHGEIDGMVVVFRDQSQFFEAQTAASRFAAIVESSHDAIVGKTLDGRIISWNKAAEQLFGYSLAEAIGMPVTRLIPLERRHEEMMILDRIGRGEKVPALQTVRMTKDGRRIDVALTISPVHDGDGRIVGAAKIVRDITAEIEALRARERIDSLERKNREVLDAMHMKTKFFASMSHELRTPLNAVIGFAQLLEDPLGPLEDNKRKQFAGHILHAGRHLLAMINDLLDLSKTQAGKVEFNPVEFDLSEVIRELTSTMRPLADSKGHRMSLDLDPDLGSVFLDASRLRQVLYNYLSNAIKFTPNCGEIVIRTRTRGRRSFLLEVQDNGIGLSEEEQAELFEEFRQLRRKPGQDEAGTGLGLALTRQLATAQGGKAGVWSVVGQGSRFFVVLPRRHRTPEDGAAKGVVVDDDNALNRDT